MDRKLLIAGAAGFGALGLGALLWWQLRPAPGKPRAGGGSAPSMTTGRAARGYIILDGRRYPTSFPVNHSLSFPIGESGTGRRNQPLVGGVLHWTAAENPGNRVFSTLSSRGISVHFAMDRDGTVWQFADPATTYTTNAGRSLGQKTWAIEIASYGMAASPPENARDRGTYQAPIHDRMRTIARFYPVQRQNVFELCNIIHDALNIPKRVAVEPDAFVPWARLRNATGIVGHYHASVQKADPGPLLLEDLARQPGWTGYTL